jgi:hypothetical protein
MATNLYDSSSSVTSQVINAVTSSQSQFSLGFLNIEFVENLLRNSNMFMLAWMIVHTIYFLADFFVFFFTLASKDDFLDNQEYGQKKFYDSLNMWTYYLPFLIGILSFSYFKDNQVMAIIIGIASLLYLLWKFLFIDFAKTPLISILTGEDTSILGRSMKSIRDVAGNVIAQPKGSTGSAVSGGLFQLIGGFLESIFLFIKEIFSTVPKIKP